MLKRQTGTQTLIFIYNIHYALFCMIEEANIKIKPQHCVYKRDGLPLNNCHTET